MTENSSLETGAQMRSLVSGFLPFTGFLYRQVFPSSSKVGPELIIFFIQAHRELSKDSLGLIDSDWIT